KLGANEQAGCCGDDLDPWCGNAGSNCPEGTLYLAVRYAECQTRPVRGGGGGGCGCDEGGCEDTRIRGSFSVQPLPGLPAGYPTAMQQPDIADIIPCRRGGPAPACPPCPKDPWVILADLTVGADCKVSNIDCFAHRRYVVSLANFYFLCTNTTGANNPL